MGLFLMKNNLLRCWGLLVPLNWIICIAKAAFKAIRPFIHFLKFLSREVVLYLYKSTIPTCMEY